MKMSRNITAKAKLRNDLKERRVKIQESLGDYKDLITTATIPALLSLLQNKEVIISGYYSINTEFNCNFLLSQLHFEYGFQVSLPVILQERTMGFRLWDCNDSSLVLSKYKIPEPSNSFQFVDPGAILVPLLGFNSSLHRLGYGGGYYDRYMSTHKSPVYIGLGFSSQLCEELETEPHDIKLDFIITENGLFK